MKRNFRAALGSLLSLAVTHSIAAQQPAPTPPHTVSGAQAPYSLQIQVQTVILDVVVTDSRGNIVTSLGKDDFQVYEDNVPQLVRSFDGPPPPPTVANNPPVHSTAELDRLEPNAPVTLIVLDEINTRFQDEAFARYSLQKFLDQQGDTLQHPTLLGAVDMNHFTLLHDYTTSRQELLSALDHHLTIYPWQMEGSSWKAEQFNASFAALMEVAEGTAGHPGHKSLLWVGRGFPPFDPTTLSAEDNAGLKEVIEACTDALRDARVTLYTIDPAGVSNEPPDVSSDGFIDDPFDGMLDFNNMAKATGGEAFFGRNDVDKLIETSSRDGSSFYTLSYTPVIPRTDTRAFHGIRVVMKNPSLRATTREGYYPQTAPTRIVAAAAKKPDRQIFDLALAAQSMLVYDAVHMSVKRTSADADQFRISLNSADLAWQQSGSHELTTKITVAVETFDKKGTMLDRRIKLSTLQVGEASVAGTPNAAMVSLFAGISTKVPAVRARFIVRGEGNQKIGTLNFDLGKNLAGVVSN